MMLTIFHVFTCYGHILVNEMSFYMFCTFSNWIVYFYIRYNWIGYFYIGHLRRRRWHPTPVLLPGKPHGRRSLLGCSPWGCKESDTTEQLHFHFSLSRIGEGNGNPLQCSCLENPRDRRAWWAAVYGVAQSQTRLKRLSSSSSILDIWGYCVMRLWILFNLSL